MMMGLCSRMALCSRIDCVTCGTADDQLSVCANQIRIIIIKRERKMFDGLMGARLVIGTIDGKGDGRVWAVELVVVETRVVGRVE